MREFIHALRTRVSPPYESRQYVAARTILRKALYPMDASNQDSIRDIYHAALAAWPDVSENRLRYLFSDLGVKEEWLQ